MIWIANLHWRRETAESENIPLLRYETELFEILDNAPDLYVRENFVDRATPSKLVIPQQTVLNITTMAV